MLLALYTKGTKEKGMHRRQKNIYCYRHFYRRLAMQCKWFKLATGS